MPWYSHTHDSKSVSSYNYIFPFLSKLLIPSCRYKGYYEYAKLKGLEVGPPVGLDILVDGTVPTGKFLNFNYINCMS